jgi:hypothetical protein
VAQIAPFEPLVWSLVWQPVALVVGVPVVMGLVL